jgi:hypothetical protein
MNKRQLKKEWTRRFNSHPWKMHWGACFLFCNRCGSRYNHAMYKRQTLEGLRVCSE